MSEISKQMDFLSDGLEAVTHFDEFISWLQLVPQSDYLTKLYVPCERVTGMPIVVNSSYSSWNMRRGESLNNLTESYESYRPCLKRIIIHSKYTPVSYWLKFSAGYFFITKKSGPQPDLDIYDDVTHICKMAFTPRNTREGHFLALCFA